MEREFSIGENNFKLLKIDAFKQFHIVRRIAPILSDLIPILSKINKSEKQMKELSEAEKLQEFAEMAAPLMNGLSKLSDDDANKVLLGLVSAVEIQQSAGNWARVASSSQIMFSNLELPVLLQIAGKSFAYNMASFFTVLPQVLPGKG